MSSREEKKISEIVEVPSLGTSAIFEIEQNSISYRASLSEIFSLLNENATGAFPNITGLGIQAQNLDMGSNRITSVANPALAQDAATKNYVDSKAAGKDELSELNDVTITSRTASQVLVANTGNTSWINSLLVNENLSSGVFGNITGIGSQSQNLNMNSNSILNISSLQSSTDNAADTGRLRLANPDAISWRNNANDGNLLLVPNQSDQLVFDGQILGNGEFNTSSNSGAGQGLALPKDGVDLPFKSLVGEDDRIVLNGNENDIAFSVGPQVLVTNADQTVTSAKQFNDQMLQQNNPAGTSQYVFAASAITADRTVTLPLVTSADTFVFENHTQILSNKTLDGLTMSADIMMGGNDIFIDADGDLSLSSPVDDKLMITWPSANDPELIMYNSASAADDAIGRISFEARHSGGTRHPYADIEVQAKTITQGSEDGKILFNAFVNGTSRTFLSVRGDNDDIMIERNMTLADETDISLDTDNGTKIGTAANQKIGFYDATPVTQRSNGGIFTGFTQNLGQDIRTFSTFTGGVGSSTYTVGSIVRALKDIGILQT